MKSSKFTESQIIKALKENENGKTAEQISRELGINKATFYNWRKQYGGMEVSQLKELKELREENAKLKRMYADQALMLEMAKDVISKSGKAFRQKNDRNLPCEKKYRASVEQSVSIVKMSRSSWYYKSRLDDSEIVTKLEEMVENYPSRGFENYYHRIRREGIKWAWCRILRVYREMGLVRRAKKRVYLPDAQRKPLQQPERHNETWSMDFMSDALIDGRTFRILNVMDDYNRECLLSQGSISFPAKRVINYLEQLKEEVGLPNYIRTDNGPEFTSNDYKDWCKINNVTPVYAEPGKPTQNGYIERLNRTFREDVLDAFMFTSIHQFNIISEKWQDDYNDYHPHQSLKYKSPREFAARVFNSFNNEKSKSDFSSLKCEKHQYL